ncbi:MAG: CYTH domain-containing protein [Alphaproteobacteria bacterium]|nr:MAG: CYTH domain-containing protein [Alphaproteobacteria bacterium]
MRFLRLRAVLAEGKVPSGEVGAREETSLASTYFDTPRRKLRRHGLSLRVRHNGDKHIQTIKSAPGAQFVFLPAPLADHYCCAGRIGRQLGWTVRRIPTSVEPSRISSK